MTPLILIPSRMGSTRLPEKALAPIAGEPMIVQVWRRAVEAGLGPVVVATDHAAIRAAVETAGGTAVMTRTDHPSGTDRIFEAAGIVDPDGRFDVIVNVQGDLPTVEPATIAAALACLADRSVAIGTAGAVIRRAEERTDPAVVKVVGSVVAPGRLRALYFTRAAAPWGEGELIHHIGLYAYRRESLRAFVGLPPSRLEAREKLEQLRALEAGWRIDVELVDTVPLGVDTPAELERARRLLEPQ